MLSRDEKLRMAKIIHQVKFGFASPIENPGTYVEALMKRSAKYLIKEYEKAIITQFCKK